MNIEALYLTIREETNKYMELVELVGKEHPMARKLCTRIYAMQQAFKIVSGMSYTDYLLSKLS